MFNINYNNKNGFTLVELLVVMSIIAILAGVSVVSLAGQRKRAIDSKAFQTMRSIQPDAYACVAAEKYLHIPGDINNPKVCDIAMVWPGLPAPWTYRTGPVNFNDGSTNNTVSFLFSAHDSTNTSKYIVCNETGCTKNGF